MKRDFLSAHPRNKAEVLKKYPTIKRIMFKKMSALNKTVQSLQIRYKFDIKMINRNAYNH